MSRRQISHAEVVQTGTRVLRDSMYHCVPGIVQTFYPGSGTVPATVDVQPAVNDVRFDPDTGARQSEPWPIVPNCPIAFPRFGGFTIAGPMRQGDRVLLVAFDLDPTAHRSTGGREDPADTRRHGGAYWWALPCDITDPGAMLDGSAAGSELVIGVDGGQPQIRINGTTVQLGATGGDFVALASKVLAQLQNIVTTFNSHTHPYVNGTTPSVTSVPSSPAPTPTSVASELIAAQ